MKKLCLRCGKNFDHSGHLKRHFKRKKLCKVNLLDVTYEEMEANYSELLECAKILDSEEPRGITEVSLKYHKNQKKAKKKSKKAKKIVNNDKNGFKNTNEDFFVTNFLENLTQNSELEDFDTFLDTDSQIIELDDDSEPARYICYTCDKIFSHKNNYYRHKKHYCKNKSTEVVKNDNVTQNITYNTYNTYNTSNNMYDNP